MKVMTLHVIIEGSTFPSLQKCAFLNVGFVGGLVRTPITLKVTSETPDPRVDGLCIR